MKEITKRNTMLEALEYFRGLKRLASKDHKGLEPAEGEEDIFNDMSAHCRNMQELIHAYESETVRQAIEEWDREKKADSGEQCDMSNLKGWQKEIMEQARQQMKDEEEAIAEMRLT